MKIVAMADSHNQHEGVPIPDGDVLVQYKCEPLVLEV